MNCVAKNNKSFKELFFILFFMVFSPSLVRCIANLDSYRVHAADLRSQLALQQGNIDSALATLREKILAGETTGSKLTDWALVAHGADYAVIASLARSVRDYLQAHEGELVALACHAEEHTKPDSSSAGFKQEKSFYLAVLGAEGFRLPDVSAVLSTSSDIGSDLSNLRDVVASISGDESYTERQSKMSYQDSFHLSEGRRLSHGFFFSLHPLGQVDETGYTLSIRSTSTGDAPLNGLGRPEESHFAVYTDTRIRLFAGTEPVLAYLKKNFWHEKMPPAASNFLHERREYLAGRTPNARTLITDMLKYA